VCGFWCWSDWPNGTDWSYRTHGSNRRDWTRRTYWRDWSHGRDGPGWADRGNRTDRCNGSDWIKRFSRLYDAFDHHADADAFEYK
jgi:hypothetical protein